MDGQGPQPGNRRQAGTSAVIAFCACLALSGCVSTNLPSLEQAGFKLQKDEQRLLNRSREATGALERSGLLVADPALEAYLNKIYRKLLPTDVHADYLQPRIRVIRQPETNAFALPNGQLYISTAMLTVMDNEAQLAAVIGHEMTHVLERHALKVKRSTANKAALFHSVSLIGPLASVAAVSSISGYSRSVEKEADLGGFKAMRAHGYDLRQAALVYDNLLQFNRDEKIHEAFFFSTHPALATRAANAQRYLKENPEQTGGVIGDKIFKEKTKQVVRDTIALWLHNGMFLSASRYAKRYIRDFPGDGYGYYLKGEVLRQRQEKNPVAASAHTDEEVLKAYTTALKKTPGLAAAYRGQGMILQKMGRLAAAKKAYQNYLKLKPGAKDYAFIAAAVKELP